MVLSRQETRVILKLFLGNKLSINQKFIEEKMEEFRGEAGRFSQQIIMAES